jgi:vanillate O-demethylase ferredoxin subunit
MDTLWVRVADRQEQAQGICSFDLVAAEEGSRLPAFTPGAHIDVHVPGGWVRQYSLCNDSTEQGLYRIGVLKADAGRGGSQAMHEQVQIGAVLRIGAPRNLFPLHEQEAHSLLLAGGIGITPIFCMAQALLREGRSFDMHYCARSKERAAFTAALQAAPLGRHVHLHLDDEPASTRLDIEALLNHQSDNTHLYFCGPKGFMDAVLQSARRLGWEEGRLHCEFFQAEPVLLDGDQSFDVRLARSGKTVHVGSHQTVAHALQAAGVDVPTSCEQGICGTCVTKVLEGVPDHRDSFLMPEEQAANDCFTPCCSRSRSPSLVLDL